MAYIISKTDGTTLVSIADGSVDTTTDLQLVGRNYFGYGLIQNENFIKLLENFANNTQPSSPLAGQLWFDKTSGNSRLKVYDGAQFKPIGSAILSPIVPSYWNEGDFWVDSGTGLLYVKSLSQTVKVLTDSGTGVYVLTNSTVIPSTNLQNSVQLYAEPVIGLSELKVRDEAGNITTLSPHNFSLIPGGASETMAWSYYSEKNGTKINVDMLKLARLLEQITGEQLVYIEESK